MSSHISRHSPKNNSATMIYGSVALIVAFVLFTIINTTYASSLFNSMKAFIANELSWYYIGVICFCLILSLWLIISPYGSIRLGKDEDRPEFSNFSWFSMLFGAGIGIGILFWSIAGPIGP